MFKKSGLVIAILTLSLLSVGVAFAGYNKDNQDNKKDYNNQYNNRERDNEEDNHSSSDLAKKIAEYKAKVAEQVAKKEAEAKKKADEEEQKKVDAEKKAEEERNRIAASQKSAEEKRQQIAEANKRVEEARQKAEAQKKAEELAQNTETKVTSNKTEEQKVDIVTKTDSATKKVEYYAEPAKQSSKTKPAEVKTDTTDSSNGVLPTYLGTADQNEAGHFNLTVDASSTLPNGTYDLKTKLYQEDGTIVEGKKKTILVETKIEKLAPEEKKKFEKSEADTDNDNIPDKEEVRLGTNPLLADSDGDGFLDGDEVKNGFDPLKFSPGDKSDKIAFASPDKNTSASVVDTNFVVNSVAIATVDITSEQKGETNNTQEEKISTKKMARFSGKALPNIFVTLYIFSDPIVVTVKTDAEGNWSYDLDKEIPDGNHEVYVAVTDNVGKITSQSRALPFVKTADAIDIVPVTSAASAEEIQKNTTPLEKSKTQFLLMMFVIMMTFVGVAFVLIGRKSSFIK